MIKHVRSIGLFLAAAVLVGAGCCKKPVPVQAPEVKPTPAPTPAPVKVEPEKPAFVPTAEPPKVEVVPDIDEMNKKGYLKDTFFDFDKYDIRQDQRDGLAANADWLKKYPTVKFTVEGHCDERGTRKYNQALGEKRASAVKDYLASLGIDPARIAIISYGKDRPFATGSNEEAWAQNRRGHFVVTAK